MENRMKLCCTCGEIKPLTQFPIKPTSHRHEAECNECFNKEILPLQRPKILGVSPIPPRLGKVHSPRKTVEAVSHKQKVEEERAILAWKNAIKEYAINQDWFTARDVKPIIQYSLQVTMRILNNLTLQGYLEKKTETRVKLYRIKKTESINQEKVAMISE